MKLKNILTLALSGVLAISLASCGQSNTDNTEIVPPINNGGDNNDGGNTDGGNTGGDDTGGSTSKPTIYLAGDSTVQTYNDQQYIGGWGQYLNLFLDDDITVVNAAKGGRSSRSFINEGRLLNITGNNYSFSENGGNSLENTMTSGDYLFIQFGHNDDSTKLQSSTDYITYYDRMTPLGTPDANGVYPVSPATKVATTHLPDAYTTNYAQGVSAAYTEIAKYGSEYYSYDCGGTYKWYLKQYIDFARSMDVTPVLVTPVARVKFNTDGTLKSGPGLHGDDFAYVKAVRQLASEENCLLIDLFNDTKSILETATSAYANYLMALKPNGLTGTWPSGYDSTYSNTDLGYEGIEATHYNKYGSYITAGKIAEAIIKGQNTTAKNNEKFNFTAKTTPESYIDPSNLMSKSIVSSVEALFDTVNVTNPNRTYNNPQEVIDKINELTNSGSVTNDNYLSYQVKCEEIRNLYISLNVDDRLSVTNLNVLVSYEESVEAFIQANRPKPTSVICLDPSTITAGTYSNTLTCGDFSIVGSSSKTVEIYDNSTGFNYNGVDYSYSKSIRLSGSAEYTSGRYIEFTTTKACSITVVAKSGGTDSRTLSLVDSSNTQTGISFQADPSITITTNSITEGGTFKIGSKGSAIYIYSIIIEYFA